MPAALNEESLLIGARCLAERDPDLARVLNALGPPPLWHRPPGFATLVYIILEQQVSLASARAAYQRLLAAADPLTPTAFLQLADERLRAVGFSRQKMQYARGLAQAVLAGALDLDALAALEAEAVRAALISIKGIGRWSADIYLMEALLHPDIWPFNDLALATAVQRVKGLPAPPKPDALETLGEAYRPWRSVAARMFWQQYLDKPPRKA